MGIGKLIKELTVCQDNWLNANRGKAVNIENKKIQKPGEILELS
jgi:hypothetical protein